LLFVPSVLPLGNRSGPAPPALVSPGHFGRPPLSVERLEEKVIMVRNPFK
jgi:hypothetical protein